MGKSSKMLKGLLSMAMSVLMIMAAMPLASLADSVISKNETGTLSIDLQYGGKELSGGTFDLYYVASLNDSSALSYTLTSDFQAAATSGKVDINAVKTAQDVENTAAALAKYLSGANKAASVTTKDGKASVSGLALGIYLVVQTAAPDGYSKASPFLAYFPMTNSDGTGLVYDYNASPKVTYNPPAPTVDVKVVKVWDDTGFQAERPASVQAGLYRNGTLYDQQTLSAENNWEYKWSKLSSEYNWTVGEINVPDNYFSFSSQSGSTWTLTNVRQNTPLSTVINVTKKWVGDSKSERPSSITVNLLCDGKLYDTEIITAANGWKYSWVGIDPTHSWSVTESNVPSGYKSSVSAVDNGFVIKNTRTTTIPDNPTPKAPQTGLLQWPIPVLSVLGAVLILLGVILSSRKKKYEK